MSEKLVLKNTTRTLNDEEFNETNKMFEKINMHPRENIDLLKNNIFRI